MKTEKSVTESSVRTPLFVCDYPELPNVHKLQICIASKLI